MERKLVLRADKVAFMAVGETPTYHRMRGFKSLPTAKNPIEYSRTYVDMYQEVTDVVGVSESKDFEFDQYVNDPVHDVLVGMIDGELLGSDAVVKILTVDKGTTGVNAILREYNVIPDTSGDGTEAYTYSGRFVASGAIQKVTATISVDGLTATVSSGV